MGLLRGAAQAAASAITGRTAHGNLRPGDTIRIGREDWTVEGIDGRGAELRSGGRTRHIGAGDIHADMLRRAR